MTLSDNSFQVDGAKERFAHLHYRAACIRLELLSQLLDVIDANGGIEQAPASLILKAVAASADVAENLRWAYERVTDTGHRRADDATVGRLDFPSTGLERRADAPRGVAVPRQGEGESPSRTPRE